MNDVFGAISLHSLGMYFPNYTREDMQGVYTRHGDGKRLNIGAFDFTLFSARETELLLTDTHEFDHFCQLVSSPFGILLFRIYTVLATDVSWIGRQFAACGLEVTNMAEGMELIPWLRKKGVDLLRKRMGRDGELTWVPFYIENYVLPGMRALEGVLSLLTFRQVPPPLKDLTVKGLCNLLNEANLYLRQRSDIDLEYEDGTNKDWADTGFKWSSRLPTSTRVFREGELFLSHGNLLETLAYLHEYRMLTKNKADAVLLKTWSEKRLPAYCKPLVAKYLTLTGGDPTPARVLLSALLTGNIDIAMGPEASRDQVCYLEEEWPFFTESTLSGVMAAHVGRINRSIEGLTNVVQRGSLFGPRSNWRTFDEMGSQGLSYNVHLERLEKVFLEALYRRRNMQKEMLQGVYGQLDLHNLYLLIETSDYFNVNWPPGMETDDGTYLSSYIFATFHPLIPSIAIRILLGKPIEDPTMEKRQKWENTLQVQAGDHVGKPLMEELTTGIGGLFTRDFIRRIFDGIHLEWYSPSNKR